MERPRSDRMRVGIVGAGVVASKHARAYSQNGHCRVVAVADIDARKGQALAAECAAKFFHNYWELLDVARVDAISVCVPHDLHYHVGLAAAKASVHLLMEKPITISLTEADHLLAECIRNRVKIMVGFVHRFREEQLVAKRLVHGGVIGEPMHALDNICTLGGHHPPAWVWQRDRAGGGVLMYGGIHSVDRLLWLIARDVREVYAKRLRYCNEGDVEDGLSAVLTFDGGAIGCLFENSPSFGKPGGWLTEIYGTTGAIRIKTGEWLEVTSAKGREIMEFDPHDHFQREIDEFVAAIREERDPWITGEDGRRALAVAQAIYRSAEGGHAVSVSS